MIASMGVKFGGSDVGRSALSDWFSEDIVQCSNALYQVGNHTVLTVEGIQLSSITALSTVSDVKKDRNECFRSIRQIRELCMPFNVSPGRSMRQQLSHRKHLSRGLYQPRYFLWPWFGF